MTQAQKIAKAKFKKAIAYRKKTGVSLKEAFAHTYGKKSAVKKKAVKKSAKKKAVGKVDTKLKKQLASQGKKMPHGYDVVKRKRKIGAVSKKATTTHKDTKSHNVNIRVMSGLNDKHINKYKNTLHEIKEYEYQLINLKKALKEAKNPEFKKAVKTYIKTYTNLLSELKTHAKELKKHI